MVLKYRMLRGMRLPRLAGLFLMGAGAGVIFATACQDQPPASGPADPPGPPPGAPGLEAQPGLAVPAAATSPVRIAWGPGATVLVSDFRNQTIYQMSVAQGTVTPIQTLTVGEPPLGVAWARNRLFVGKPASDAVDVYEFDPQAPPPSGTYPWLYRLGGSAPIEDPTDIAVDTAQGLVFVLDVRARRIKAFDLDDGAPRVTISSPGLAADQLQNPAGLAVDVARQEVLVSDYGEPTESSAPPALKIFDYQGALLASFSGRLGMLGQRFSRPQGLAVDGKGHILVADALAGEVIVFDRQSGAILTTFGTFGSGAGQLWLPLDVILDGNADLLVTNNRPGRIEIFPTGGQIP